MAPVFTNYNISVSIDTECLFQLVHIVSLYIKKLTNQNVEGFQVNNKCMLTSQKKTSLTSDYNLKPINL